MEVLYQYALLFFVGGVGGWILEFFFRRIVHKRWMNPGFLTGPCLPLYGFGVCVLYLLSNLNYEAISSNHAWQNVFVVCLLGVGMTVLEYLAGLLFIKGLHIKLWDYGDRWGNIQGIICPLFSLAWFAIAALYYFVVNPDLIKLVQDVASWPPLGFVVGILLGVILVDFITSLHLSTRLRQWAKESRLVISYEAFKDSIHAKMKALNTHSNFLLPFKTKTLSLKEHFEHYVQEAREELAARLERRKKKQNRHQKDPQKEE